MASNLFRGTLNLLILEAVRLRQMHGYAIGKWIRDNTEGVLDVEEGLLYPTLHRLSARGLLKTRWGKSESNRKVKFYRITRKGEKQLQSEESNWRRYSNAVQGLLDKTDVT